MKTLYLDCGMGAAGDMLAAALLELLPDPEAFVKELNALGLPGVEYVRTSAAKCGVTGTHLSVRVNGVDEFDRMEAQAQHHDHDHAEEHHHDHDHAEEHHHDHDHAEEHHHGHDHAEEHHHDHDHAEEQHHDHDHAEEHHHSHSHTGMSDIRALAAGLPVSEKARQDILAVYELIAGAESSVHGVPVEQIHFHEVGTMDAIADVTAVCLLMERLAPEQVLASPVHVGAGTVRCAHGILPVPAPAAALLLKGIPIYGGRLQGELCTPTGAALLRHFVSRFGELPVIRTERVGYGMGSRDFPVANCLRALLGETEGETETACELSLNVDDMTPEELGYAMERLFEAGALEVYTVPVGMKKNRPGTLLRVICTPEQRERLLPLIFRHTSTLGVREVLTRRYVLRREVDTEQTPLGELRVKRSSGYGVTREKYEYDDLAGLARKLDLPLSELKKRLNR